MRISTEATSMYDTILVPFDGSDESRKGAEHAIDLAASVGATIHALYVVDLPGAPRTVYIRDDEEEMRERYHDYGEEVTTEVAEMAADSGVDCVTAIKTGSVHEEVVDYAEDEGIDLIVMGTGYRGKVGAILGGTAEKVVRTSTTPVTTVRKMLDE
jgi:nucleotide-binding universal stress UspA family protein